VHAELTVLYLLGLNVLICAFHCVTDGLVIVQSHYKGDAEFYVCHAADGARQLSTLDC